MRILLFNPELPHEGVYQIVGFILPPLNILYVAKYLVNAGHHVEIFDKCTDDEDSVDLNRFDLVGLTADTPRVNYSLRFAKKAKEAGKIVVMGGTHATFQDLEVLSTGYVDYVVRGEGELTAVDLCNQIEQQGDKFNPSTVNGISYLDQDGKLVRTVPREFMPDLKSLPFPARELVDMNKYRILKLRGEPITSLFSSRGCPFRCSFCVSKEMLGCKWRARTPKNVVDEIEMLYKEYNYKAQCFLEDNFCVDVQRVNAICEEIRRRKLDILWWTTARADSIVKNEEMIANMARAGLDTIFVGIESPNDHMLKELGKKKVNADISKEAVRIMKKYNISSFAAMMVGGVSESYEDIMNTVKYAIEIEPTIVQFSVLTPYPGTVLYEQMKNENRIKVHNWEMYDCTHGVIETDHFQPHEMDKILKEVYYKFYGRPYRIIKHSMSFLKGYTMSPDKILKMINGINPNVPVSNGLTKTLDFFKNLVPQFGESGSHGNGNGNGNGKDSDNGYDKIESVEVEKELVASIPQKKPQDV